ncbi:amino acid adenylation domain-containing protein [Streptomyces sp. LX-29]|uniref:amino acid adenylation domain-containing protein n=1 Tax=Streptomyces sp. LX-29 TaxID=2900152 RepID=UPI00240E7F81|nr:amino acid adenylation domain-containing protein [Streptomyces sp. LX-29]WFB11199.1 amino acid adenylation domain-containing protein [Streptomyces sp. LX-29]
MTTSPHTPLASVAYGGSAPADGWDDVLARYTHWVQRAPHAPAVEDGALSWTFAELDVLAERTADALRGRVRPGDLVAVCLDRSAALVATAVAVARLGAVYLPLGPRPGERRLAVVTGGLRVACLVTAPDTLPEGYATGARLALPLPTAGANAAAEVVAAFPAHVPAADPAPASATGGPATIAATDPAAGRATDPAASGAERPAVPEGTLYAMLTSGSTGVPKAVAVPGTALAARIRWYAARTGCRPGDRHSLLVGVSFDPHILELWTALTSGATLAVAPDEVRWDPQTLTSWWRRAGVSVAILPTPLAEIVLERPWPELPALRHLTIGGDRLRRRPGRDVTARVDNAYGPAEACVVATTHAVEPADGAAAVSAPPIGAPLDDTVVCVTDPAGRVVPRGEPGELRIGGVGLATGYLDPELTARRFVAAPAEVTGTDRVYRTGDRVRMRPDGVLEFLGRLDDQVKVRGARIEPAETEAAFEEDPRVLRAVVAAETPAGGDTRLIAFVRPVPGAEPPTAAELLDAVRGRLPEQAQPSAVRFVDAFPLDANGKVDRAALLAGQRPERESAPAAAAGAGASTGTEAVVVEVCRTLLGRPELGPGDNFLASGGDSLTAGRLLVALEERFGVRLRAPQVLRQPDLRGLAALVDSRVEPRREDRDGAEAPMPTARGVDASTPVREAAGAVAVADVRGAAAASPEPRGVLARVLDHAGTTPSALAVTDGEVTMTYAELASAARRLAGALRSRGVGPGTAVGLLLPHSVGVVVAGLAVWWAGGHYVPLDAAYPRSRTDAMRADAGVALTVGHKELLEGAGIPAAEALVLTAYGVPEDGSAEERSADGARADDEPDLASDDLPTPVTTDPDALAYVMYTSGSTGRPKGVAITQRGAAWLASAPGGLTVGVRDRVLCHSALTFDGSSFELWMPLANGAAVAVSTGGRQSLERLARDVERLGVTVAFLTTALFHHLAARRSSVFGVLRAVVVGGEAMAARHARAVLRAHPWLELVNAYGPTETTTFATGHRVRDADCDAPPPIGRPVAGATARVLDERGEPVPPGVRGELWVGGPRVAAGYLGQPERTAERFVAHASAGRLYRTGDLVSARPDGTLDFHGRVDEQVKIRGFRIEPGEIEHALRTHPGVADAAVAVARPSDDDARLVAFVVPALPDGLEGPAGSGRPAATELRAHLAARLPAHLIPNTWSVVDALPLSGGGKVDRQALAERAVPGSAQPAEDPGPPSVWEELTPVQQAVADAWGRALGCEVTSPAADFLDLGGHSLLALGVVDDLRQELGVELTLAAFFAAPTVAAHAVLVERELIGAYGAEAEAAEEQAPVAADVTGDAR